MAPDRHAVEKRRFARLLGLDDAAGFGLPIGVDTREDSHDQPTRTDGDVDHEMDDFTGKS